MCGAWRGRGASACGELALPNARLDGAAHLRLLVIAILQAVQLDDVAARGQAVRRLRRRRTPLLVGEAGGDGGRKLLLFLLSARPPLLLAAGPAGPERRLRQGRRIPAAAAAAATAAAAALPVPAAVPALVRLAEGHGELRVERE